MEIFFYSLRSGESANKTALLNELMNISPEIRNQIGKKLEVRANNEKNPKILPEDRFRILRQLVYDKNRIPTTDEIYQGINVGAFLKNLFRGHNKPSRTQWFIQLAHRSENIKAAIIERLSNTTDHHDGSTADNMRIVSILQSITPNYQPQTTLTLNILPTHS